MTYEEAKPYLEIGAYAVGSIAGTWGFLKVCYSLSSWAINNAKNAGDIPLLRKEIIGFRNEMVLKLDEIESIIKRTDGSTIADETAKLSEALYVEQKKNESFSSYFLSPSSS
jgi:hypothetical protein